MSVRAKLTGNSTATDKVTGIFEASPGGCCAKYTRRLLGTAGRWQRKVSRASKTLKSKQQLGARLQAFGDQTLGVVLSTAQRAASPVSNPAGRKGRVVPGA